MSPRLAHTCRTAGSTYHSPCLPASPSPSVPRLIAEISAVLPLLPVDIIFTGTPADTGAARQPQRFLQPGDIVETWVEGIDTLRNRAV
jgi:2-keto-4-pentenoate hydratase/2-oxohepta-3-ene-1,7-dioic acid hydratase in catechol pathway